MWDSWRSELIIVVSALSTSVGKVWTKHVWKQVSLFCSCQVSREAMIIDNVWALQKLFFFYLLAACKVIPISFISVLFASAIILFGYWNAVLSFFWCFICKTPIQAVTSLFLILCRAKSNAVSGKVVLAQVFVVHSSPVRLLFPLCDHSPMKQL